MSRDDFSANTINTLARRAGFLCTCPGCNELTVGPSSQNEKSINLGVASHIAAAAPGGPRYDDNMSSEERSSLSNAIWLCKKHSELIDKDPQHYSIELLKSWKEKHEKKIGLMLEGTQFAYDRGVLTKLIISNFARIISPNILEFGRNTILIGGNNTGKTMLCKLLTSFSDTAYLEYWTRKVNRGNSYIEIEHFNGKTERYKININNEHVTYYKDQTQIPIMQAPFYIHYLGKHFYFDFDNFDDDEEESCGSTASKRVLNQIVEYLGITHNDFQNLINHKNDEGLSFVEDIYIENNELMVRTCNNKFPYSFESLSGSEIQEVLLELSIKLASIRLKDRYGMLIIEQNVFSYFDKRKVNNFLEKMANRRFPFQILVTMYYLGDYDYNLTDYKVWKLVENNREVSLISIQK